MGEIQNDQGTSINFVAFEANTVPASTSSLIGVVNANVDLSVVGVDEPASLGGALVYIIDITGCRIISLFSQVSMLYVSLSQMLRQQTILKPNMEKNLSAL